MPECVEFYPLYCRLDADVTIDSDYAKRKHRQEPHF